MPGRQFADHAPRRTGLFFLLVLACSVPLWLLGAKPDWLPIDLPASAMAALLPAIVGFALVAWDMDLASARRWALGALSWGRARWPWLLLACALYPAALLAEYGAMRALGQTLPDFAAPPLTVAAMLAMFIVGGVGEELGWQGYAYPPLEQRFGALGAALVTAAFWLAWHIVPFLQTERDGWWIGWQLAAMVPLRHVTVWIYLGAGRSVLAAVLFHASGNLAQFLFPRFGSHYDPFINCIALSLVALAVLPMLLRHTPDRGVKALR